MKVKNVVEKEKIKNPLKVRILDLLYDADWYIGIAGTTQDAFINDFYLENEDSVIEELIKMIKEDK